MNSELVPFRRLVRFAIGGGWGAAEPRSDEDLPVTIIRGTDFAAVRNGELHACPHRWETRTRAVTRALQAGDIVLEISGGNPRTGQSTGRSLHVRSGVLTSSDEVVIPASFCRRVAVETAIVRPRFAYFLLQDMWQSGRARRYENQSTGISNFQFEYFLDEERVWLPSLDEQDRIVGVLGSLDDKIDSNRRLVSHLSSVVLCLHEHVRSEATEVRTLADLCLLVSRGITPKYLDDGGVMVLNQRCIRNGSLDFVSSRRHDADVRPLNARRVAVGDILINSTGVGTLGRVARVGWLPESDVTSDSHVTIVRANKEVVDPTYLAAELLARQDEIASMGEGSTGQTELSRKRLGSLTAGLPSNEAQARFAGVAGPAWDWVSALEREALTTQRIRDILLPKLISGKIRVPDAPDSEEVIGPAAEELESAAS